MNAYKSSAGLHPNPRARACAKRGLGLRFALLALGALTAIGCEQRTPRQAQPAEAPTTPTAEHFGGPFEGAEPVGLSALLKNPENFENRLLATGGEVRRACSRKGCWMELAEGDARCRVTFKDYGFFVPTDSSGAQAKLEGRVEVKRIPAARVRHLEAEGATVSNKKADGSAFETRLVATAVDLVR